MAIADDVMVDVAAKLNDPSRSVYTNTVQLPFVGMANRELQILLELNGIPILKDKSVGIRVPAGAVEMPQYPPDFIEPIILQERTYGSDEGFIDMEEREWVPDENLTNVLRFWVFQDNAIKLLGAKIDREVKMKYRRNLNPLTVAGSNLEIADSQPWLVARVCQMIENDVMNSPSRANERIMEVRDAKDNLIRKLLKNTQALGVRRRPYRGAGKRLIVGG